MLVCAKKRRLDVGIPDFYDITLTFSAQGAKLNQIEPNCAKA
jgi:hypothetical protein